MPPTLVLVTGPSGSGKTTLAHRLAGAIGAPALSRDEIKEGMVLAAAGAYRAEPGDALTMAATELFFDLIERMVGAGVTVVAEAAFQDHLWRRFLEPVLARHSPALRIIRCVTEHSVARQRAIDRPVRTAHADHSVIDDAGYYDAFVPISLPGPALDVDTTSEYRPGLGQMVAFATG